MPVDAVSTSRDGDAPRRRRAVLYVTCLIVVVLTAVIAVWAGGSAEPNTPPAAEGGGPGAGNGPETGNDPETGNEPGAGSGENENTSGQPSGPRVIAWIGELGPLGGAGPHHGRERAYPSLVQGECDQVLPILHTIPEPSRSVYEGAASACLAAFHNQPQLWSRAQAALTTVGSQTSQDCFDKPVHQLLQSLVEVHRQDPGAQFVTRFGSGSAPPCPRVLELIPDHGPREGGYQIRLIGVSLPPMAGIHFGETYLTVNTNDGREAVITVPPADAVGAPVYEQDGYSYFSVWAEGWPIDLPSASIIFAYDPAEQTERTESAPPASSPPTS